VEVRPGESIQEAVDKAGRNGIVRIYPGTYHENVLVIHHGVTIEGGRPQRQATCAGRAQPPARRDFGAGATTSR
jgi:hypothetical protein